MTRPSSGKRRGTWMQLSVKIVVMGALLATILAVMYNLSKQFRIPGQPPQAPAAITVVVDPQAPEGVVFGFEGRRYTQLESLTDALTRRAKTNPRAVVDPDGDAPWGTVMDVFRLAEGSGFTDVHFAAATAQATSHPATAP